MSHRPYCTFSKLIEKNRTHLVRTVWTTRFSSRRIAYLSLFIAGLWLNFLGATERPFTIPVNDIISLNTLANCDSSFHFLSDTSTLYTDTIPRSDTISFCPPNQWQRVKVTFSAFDLAAGDTLFAYDGKTPDSPLLGKSSGYGTSRAFGSWVAAHCAPDINQTGCLSFIFKTNGDHIKATGWKALVNCEERNIQLKEPNIFTSASTCNRTYEVVAIPSVEVTTDCGGIDNDSTYVRIRNATGMLCLDTCLSHNRGMSLRDTFGFGTYLVEYILKSDTTKKIESVFLVNRPNLVCNDRLSVSLGEDCNTMITPDILLENLCDTIRDTLYYQIIIKKIDKNNSKENGKVIASGTGRAGDYPIITKDLIDFCEKDDYLAEITQVYYDNLNLSFCNNGPQKNTCQIILNFEDKAPPVFQNKTRVDTIYACNFDLNERSLGLLIPSAVDNCSAASVELENIIEISPIENCNALKSYLVIWKSEDDCGNIRKKSDTIRVIRPGLDKIIKPQNVILSCGEDSLSELGNEGRLRVPSIQVGRQRNGLFIPVDTLPLSENQPICGYILQKSDLVLQSDCGSKHIRYWTLADWCAVNTAPVLLDTQIIEFRDTLAPVFDCLEFGTLSSAKRIHLPAFSCQTKVNMEAPMAKDNCVNKPIVKVFRLERLVDGEWQENAISLFEAGELECDSFRVSYRAFDACFEQTKEDTCYQYFIIEDPNAPEAICHDQLTISLSNNAHATKIYADVIDGGSWDACGIDTILVRRSDCENINQYGGDGNLFVANQLENKIDPVGWSSYVSISCCDLKQTAFVELLVIDKKRNYNTCMVQVKVEDKIAPFCEELDNKTFFCNKNNLYDLGTSTDSNGNGLFDGDEWQPLAGIREAYYNQQFGDPLKACEDNASCQDLTLEQAYQLIAKGCGVYYLKRRYRAIDTYQNQSEWLEQHIEVKYQADWKITFPTDQAGDCNAPLDTPAISIRNGGCDLLSWRYEDRFFSAPGDVFTHVERTFSIINWCLYEPGDQALIIKRHTNHNDFVEKEVMITSDSFPDVSFIQYTQILRVVDEDAPFLFIGKIDTVLLGKGDAFPPGEEDQTLGEAPFECDAVRLFQVFARDCDEAGSEHLQYLWELLMDGALMETGTGDVFTYTVYPGPEYQVNWFVTDVFSNTSFISESYIFVDGIKPTPYCISGIVAETNPSDRFAKIYPELLDLGSYDNCTDQKDLDKRLWHPVLNIPQPETLEEVLALPTWLELGCIYQGEQEVALYIIDEAGNFDYCISTVEVQNNMLACTRRLASGTLLDPKGQPIEGAVIYIQNETTRQPILSDHKGSYEATLPAEGDFIIKPDKNTEPLNGVSTYDLVQISQHILSEKLFDAPWQFIAADANNSGTVTAYDIVLIRQLILNILPAFPHNTSWRFIDKNIQLKANAPQIDPNAEEIRLPTFSGDRLGMDFLGIKIGDVNGSAVPNRLLAAEGRSNRNVFTLLTDNQSIEKGKVYKVPFFARQFDQINGYQGTLNFQHLKLLDIIGGVASPDNFGRSKEAQGILTISWHSLQSHEAAGSSLFTLIVRATKDGQLNELLKITSDYTPAEAYSFSGDFLDVSLEFWGRDSPLFRVYQNKPNPFSQQTVIGFDLLAATTIILKVINVQGQTIKKIQKAFSSGYNEINLSVKDLPVGTYYYQLSTPFGLETKKMVKVQ